MPPLHTSRDFETELAALRARAIAMGARCERSVTLALEALWSSAACSVACGATCSAPDGAAAGRCSAARRAADLAAQVMAVDLDIDRDAIEIDALVLRILALRQPVADDLRLLTASMKVVRDLERIGDEAVNIAERVAENAGGETSLVRAELEVLAEEARLMLESALKAFVDGDVERAHGVLLSDDAVDRRYSAIVVGMGNHMAERAVNVARGLLVVRVAKYLERIADHATNVAESVIFISRGEDVRHRQLAPAL